MKARQFHEEEDVEVSIDDQENPGKTSSSTKLERRRRIEELAEERRLREELSEF